MIRIKRLTDQEARKIAAGEVVERPANVVKELIENAIDEQAHHITLHIEDGGKKLIRVVDTGCGMSNEDAHLCFEHHATSKITTVDDLNTIRTFGFRGEALSSISAVGKITLSTKEESTQSGTQLELENGSIIHEQSISRARGTDIAVHDLFYNIPARKKFLKTRETEWRHITQLFCAFCLAYRSIHFSFYADGKEIYNCPPAQSIMDRLAQLWDHHLVRNMLELKQAETEDSISGVISTHSYLRFDRNMIFLFVNNRWIKNYHLSRALLRGYTNVLQPAHYPAACIFISIDPTYIDINIHPRKEEVKFLHPRNIESKVQEIVKQTLQGNISAHLQRKEATQITYSHSPNSSLRERISSTNEISKAATFVSFDFNKPAFIEPQKSTACNQTQLCKEQGPIPTSSPQPKVTEIHTQETIEEVQEYKIIGQLHQTYILLDQEDGLFIIDQHAAHERILYEQFSKRFEDSATVKLLFPQVIHLSNEDLNIIKPHLQQFKKKGIDIEVFGTDQLIVHATPVHLQHIALDDILKQTIGWIIEYQQLNEDEFCKSLNEKIHAKMACSAAVKAGDNLSMQQMQKLVNDLEYTENRLTCPHGRPTGWLLTKHEIEKKFKRDYRSFARLTLEEPR